jgi:hypothetical protein
MGIDEGIVDGDFRMEMTDVPDAAHVGGEMVDLVNVLRDPYAIVVIAQVRDNELVGGCLFELRTFDVGPTHAVALPDKIFNQMVPNETRFSTCRLSLGRDRSKDLCCLCRSAATCGDPS